jgi:hypothetical protein
MATNYEWFIAGVLVGMGIIIAMLCMGVSKGVLTIKR